MTTTEHKTTVRFQRGWREYLASCSCAWVGSYVKSKVYSEAEAREHEEAAAKECQHEWRIEGDGEYELFHSVCELCGVEQEGLD